MSDQPVHVPPPEPIHEYFALSYASYLVLPRSILQSMPVEWQQKFVGLLGECVASFGHLMGTSYDVKALNRRTDDLADYERGRRRLEPAVKAEGGQ